MEALLDLLPPVFTDLPPEWVIAGAALVVAIATGVYALESRRLRRSNVRHRNAIEAASLPSIAIVRRPYETTLGVGNVGFSPAIDVDVTLTIHADEEGVGSEEVSSHIGRLHPGSMVPFTESPFAESPLTDLHEADGPIYDTYDEVTMHVEYRTVGDEATTRTTERTYGVDELLSSLSDRTEPIVDDGDRRVGS